MTRRLSQIAAGLVILLGPACSPAPEPSGDKLEVFVSILPQASFVERIGGGRVRVHVLVQPSQDPHTFEPTPKDMMELARARLYFTIGIPFEEQLAPRIRETHKQLTVVDSTAGMESAAHHDEASADPHVWLSPPLIRIQAVNIAQGLGKTDPAHAAEYEANLKRFLKDLDETDARIRRLLEPFRGRAFYVFHPAFGQFAKAYGLREEVVELEGKSPTPKQLAELIQKAKSDGVRVIFVQPQFDKRAAEAVAQALNGSVAPLDPLAKDVLKNLEAMAASIAHALQQQRTGSA